jgi:hypothetical protein
MGLKRALVLCLAASAGALLSIELVFRTVYHDQLRSRSFPLVYQADPKLGYRFIPGITGTICVPSVCKAFTINRNGFPGPDYSPERTTGVYRIAVVGTSNETGIWLNSEKTYLQLLEKRFAAENIRVEILNFSIDGAYRDVENVIVAGTAVLERNPDLVLLYAELPFRFLGASRAAYRGYMLGYDPRAPETLAMARAYIDWLLSYTVLIALYEHSYIVRALAKAYAKNPERPYASGVRTFIYKRFESPDLRVRPISLKRSLETLRELRQRVQASGAELYLFRYVPNREWSEALSSAGLPSLILNVGQTAGLIYEDSHYSEEGHRQLAEQLYSELTARGIPRPQHARIAPP